MDKKRKIKAYGVHGIKKLSCEKNITSLSVRIVNGSMLHQYINIGEEIGITKASNINNAVSFLDAIIVEAILNLSPKERKIHKQISILLSTSELLKTHLTYSPRSTIISHMTKYNNTEDFIKLVTRCSELSLIVMINESKRYTVSKRKNDMRYG